jgi:hypothetical protein
MPFVIEEGAYADLLVVDGNFADFSSEPGEGFRWGSESERDQEPNSDSRFNAGSTGDREE